MLDGLRILYDPKGRFSQALPSVMRNDSDDPKRPEVADSCLSQHRFCCHLNDCFIAIAGLQILVAENLFRTSAVHARAASQVI